MLDYDYFDSARLSIDRFAVTIVFYPLIDREHAFRWLQRLNHESVSYYSSYAEGADVDWCSTVLDFLQSYFMDRSDLFGDKGRFYQTSAYLLNCRLPVGVFINLGKVRNSKIKHSEELYGPYQPGKAVRYHHIYESYDSVTQIRLDWNPNNVDIRVLREFLVMISLGLGFEPENDIKITQIDWAVDFPEHYSLSLVTCSKTLNMDTMTDRSGGITKYIGARESNLYVRIYNKKIELKKKKKVEHPNEHFFRFESVNTEDNYLGETDKILSDVFKNVLLLSDEKLNNCDDMLIYSWHKMSILADCHFDAIAEDVMGACLGDLSHEALKKRKSRIKKKYRSLVCSTVPHPSSVFNENKVRVWAEFKKSFLSNFA